MKKYKLRRKPFFSSVIIILLSGNLFYVDVNSRGAAYYRMLKIIFLQLTFDHCPKQKALRPRAR